MYRSFLHLTVVLSLAALLWAPPLPAAAQGEDVVRHTVTWGETLSGIALQYGTTATALAEANDLAGPDLIRPGQVLVIPGSVDTPEPLAPARPTEHVVQRGEYLSGIAALYGVSVEQLAAANGLTNPRLIHAGVILRIPDPSEPVADPTSPPVATAPEVTPTAALPAAPTTYSVLPGDNLTQIAARFGVSVAELIAVNSLADPSLIHVGLVLTLPEGASPVLDADARPVPTVTEGKQVIVVLSQQKVYAFENAEPVAEFVVSTGLPDTPTVQGDFAVYVHIASQLMRGRDYDLPNVQWVMYFYRDYALHGTYWHDNFGRPMSRGCVNMRNEDAEWLYHWAPDGTPVRVIA